MNFCASRFCHAMTPGQLTYASGLVCAEGSSSGLCSCTLKLAIVNIRTSLLGVLHACAAGETRTFTINDLYYADTAGHEPRAEIVYQIGCC